MRQIKFRAWHKEQKVMVYDNEDHSDGWWDGAKCSNLAMLNARLSDSEYEMMQYTGLTDKNGAEIWEGDVVWCRAGEHLRGIWEYEKQFIVEYGWSQSMWEMSLCDEIEVIGNIYDNPKLCEVRE